MVFSRKIFPFIVMFVHIMELFEHFVQLGDDGFPVKFYEAFLDLLGGNLLDCYNEGFNEEQLSISQRRGIISLKPKGDENLNEITCWCPVTLLNVNYKIITRIIATRIEPSLPSLIHSDQTGFIKGRYTGQNRHSPFR